jgi:hypothetical protein
VDLILSNKKSSLAATVRIQKVALSSNWLVIIVLDLFDYCFPENGLTAYRLGKKLASQVPEKKKKSDKQAAFQLTFLICPFLEFHWLDRRRKLRQACQLLLALHCRYDFTQETVGKLQALVTGANERVIF